MILDNNSKCFIDLLQAGLWEHDVKLAQYQNIDFNVIYRLAEEQSVLGLVVAGFDHVDDVKVPQKVSLTFIGGTLQLEQHNKAMNEFVGKLIEYLREEDVYAILVKGQGIAQCYERPLWRACGDVDLLLSNENYKKAKSILIPLAKSVESESAQAKHLGMTIDSFIVELHGSLRSCSLPKMDRIFDEVQKDVFCNGNVRSWVNGNVTVFLPSPDNDVFFIFTHIIKHLFHGGVGLRQICDLCRILWTYKESIDRNLLYRRLKSAGIITEWRAFASLAVNTLGMPDEAMPFYSPEIKWKRKADAIVTFAIEVGIFGHNRDYSYRNKYPYIIYKAISFWKHLKDGAFFFSIFPLDSIKVTWRRMVVGVSVALQGKKHE